MNNKQTVFSNLAWRFAERFGAQLISMVVSIVLARLLMPEDYGAIALVNVFIVILQVFVDSGMGSALIQKYDADDLDFSTVFYFNIVLCLVIYAILFLLAPWIADFYNNESLIPIIRVVGITIIVSGVKNIQQAYVSRNMLFRKFFFATIGGTLVSAVVGIWMAYMGWGVWALVAQHLTNLIMDTAILWITVKWRPKLKFSWKRFRILFSYGWRLLVSALIDKVYTNLRSLIIGKKYTSEDLAFYQKGQQFPSLIVANTNSAIGSVLFPTLSKEQKDPQLLKSHVRRSIKISSYIMWPMMAGLAACATPLVRLLLTDKWLFCVPYLQIACFTYGLMPIHTSNLQAIKALGRSDIFLKLEILKKVIGLAVLLFAAQYGVMAMAVSAIFTNMIATVINSWPNKKLIDYTYGEQMKDMLPSFLLASVMGIAVFQWTRLNLSPIITLLIQIPTGAVIYVLGSLLFKFDSFQYLYSTIKTFLQKKHKK